MLLGAVVSVDDVRVVSEVVDRQPGQRLLHGAATRRHVLQHGELAVARRHRHGQHQGVFRHVAVADADHAGPKHLLASLLHRQVGQLEARQLVVLRHDDHVDRLRQHGPLPRVGHVHVEVILLRLHAGGIALDIVDPPAEEVRQLERIHRSPGVAALRPTVRGRVLDEAPPRLLRYDEHQLVVGRVDVMRSEHFRRDGRLVRLLHEERSARQDARGRVVDRTHGDVEAEHGALAHRRGDVVRDCERDHVALGLRADFAVLVAVRDDLGPEVALPEMSRLFAAHLVREY